MKLPKRTNICLVAMLIILNIILRYPWQPHLLGVDSYMIHGLAQSITQNGYAKWLVNPLSAFGMYPHSTPSAGPFLLSGIELTCGTSLEFAILIFSITIGILGAMTAYMIAREIKKGDDLFAFLVAFLFSLSPLFLNATSWTAGMRGFFMALLPLTFWFIIKYREKLGQRNIYFGLLMFLFVTLGSIHRLGIVIPIFIVTFYLSSLMKNILSKVHISPTDKIKRNSLKASYYLIFVGILGFQIIQLSMYPTGEYQYFEYEGGGSISSLLKNILMDYAGKVGPFFVLGAIGFVHLCNKERKNYTETFFLLSLFSISFFITRGTYAPHYVLLFFVILIGFGFMFMIEHWKYVKKMAFPILTAGLIISLVFSNWMVTQQWGTTKVTPERTRMLEQGYSCGFFINFYAEPDDSMLYRDGRSNIVFLSSERPFPKWVSAYTLAYDYVDIENLRIERISVWDIPETEAFYKESSEDYAKRRSEFGVLEDHSIDETTVQRQINEYRMSYMVRSKTFGETIFGDSVFMTRYELFENEYYTIHFLYDAS